MINTVYRLTAPKRFEIAFEDMDINKNGVIVRPTFLSICNADQRYYQGTREPKVLEKKLPMALIHEAIGEVVYDPLKLFKKGERVVLIPNIPGKTDDYIKENYRLDSSFCSSGTDGFLQEYVQITPDRLLVLPECMPDTIAAFTELLSVSYHAIMRFLRLSHGRREEIAVWGDGNLGYITALLLKKILPESNISIIGKHGYKLSDFTFADRAFLLTEMKEEILFDHVFECIGNMGSQTALEMIVKNIKPQGIISLLGVSEYPIQINTRMVLEKGLLLQGNSRSGREDFEGLLELIKKNEDIIEYLGKLISSVIVVKTIADIQNAFEQDTVKNSGKTIISWKK